MLKCLSAKQFAPPHQKCGEVFYNPKAVYKVLCTLCNRHIGLNCFRVHYLRHLRELATGNTDDMAKMKPQKETPRRQKRQSNRIKAIVARRTGQQQLRLASIENVTVRGKLAHEVDDSEWADISTDSVELKTHSKSPLYPLFSADNERLIDISQLKPEDNSSDEQAANTKNPEDNGEGEGSTMLGVDNNNTAESSLHDESARENSVSDSIPSSVYEEDNNSNCTDVVDDNHELPNLTKNGTLKRKRGPYQRLVFDVAAALKDPNFTCVICSEKHTNKHGLATHLRVHKPHPPPTGEKFQCPECDKTFSRARLLQTHLYKHTGFVCDICKQTYSSLGNLMRHQIIHGDKQFTCEECGDKFFTIYQLRIHNAKHTGIRNVICDLCGKPCRDGGVLAQHMLRHTGERPVACPHCDKRFYSNHDLKNHIVIHSNDRPFVCDVCGTAFQRKKALRVHTKSHSTEERTVECKLCGKLFAKHNGLLSHMRVHDFAYGQSYPINGWIADEKPRQSEAVHSAE